MQAFQILERYGVAASGQRCRQVARGGNGEVWRVDVNGRAFAVKRLFGAAPSEERVAAEQRFRDAAVARGIRAPRALRSVGGKYVETVGGAAVRLSDWVPGQAVTPQDPGRADWLGRTLGTLHTLDHPVADFPPPQRGTVPEAGRWDDLSERARAAGCPWAAEFTAAIPVLREIGAEWVDDADRPYVVSHHDVQPSNVVFDGGFTLLDWDGAGPINPARELVSRLVTWHLHGSRIDEYGIRATMRAYRDAGGIVTPTAADAFGGAPDALHYLAGQASLSLDPAATPATRAFAEAEVQALLAELCPPAVLRRVPDLCRRYG